MGGSDSTTSDSASSGGRDDAGAADGKSFSSWSLPRVIGPELAILLNTLAVGSLGVCFGYMWGRHGARGGLSSCSEAEPRAARLDTRSSADARRLDVSNIIA